MQIGVGGTFQFSEIFGGTLGFTTDCTLAIAGDYYLIYAEMTDFDVLAALDKAFALDLGTASLTVASAGFFTFAKTASSAPQLALRDVFPQSPVPATVAAISTPVTRTASFWLSVDLGGANDDKGLFGSLVDIGVSRGSQLSLSATFASGTQASTAIRTAQYTAALSGTITLFDVFAFSDVVVSYSVGAATRIGVSGKIAVAVFDSHFTFSGWVRSDSSVQAVTANVAAEGTANLASLFGGSFPNIAFTGLAFNAYYPYGNDTRAAQFMLRGACDFAGLQFAGLLYLQGTKPVLASVVFTQSASIGTLFDQCIAGASWPSGLVDLTIDAGSQAYYNGTSAPVTLTLSNDGSGPTLLPVPQPPPPGQSAIVPPAPVSVTFDPGFNLAASFELNLLDTIAVAGKIVVNGKGVTASIAIAQPIDIYVVQITRQGDPTRGPVLSIATQGNGGTMGFQGSLRFFGEDFGLDVTVVGGRDRAGNLQVTTSLNPTKDYPPLLAKSDRLGFTYGRADGFRITDWPAFAQTGDLIDFFAELKKLADAAGSGCGAIADFVMTDLLTQRYTCTPSFGSDAKGLSLSLSIRYALSFSGQQFADIALPNALVVPIPTGVNLDAGSDDYLWKVIARAIGAAAQSFVTALLDNPGAIGTFLTVFAGRKAAGYAATLICQGIVDAAVDAAVAAGVDAAGAAIGTAGIAAVLGTVATAAAAAGGSSGGGGGGRSNPPPAPAGLTASTASNTVTASWRLSSGAQNYAATLSGPDGVIAASGLLPYDASGFTFANVQPPASLPATGTIAVVASNDAGSSAAATTPVTFLAPPTDLVSEPATATAPDVAVKIGWTGAAGATGYGVDVSGGMIRHLTTATSDQVVTFTPADPVGDYVVGVAATGSASAMPSRSVQITLNRLAAPGGLVAQPDTAAAPNVGIALSWTAVTAATAYAVAVTGGKSARVDAPGPTAALVFTPADPPGTYAITVEAQGAARTIPSAPSAPLTLTRLAPPVGLAAQPAAATPPGAAAGLRWTGVDGATAYAISVPGAATDRVTSTAVAATVRFAATDPAGPYAVTVAADGDAATIASVASQAITLTRLPAPANLSASATATTIDATWTGVAGAASYALVWTSPSGRTGADIVPAAQGDGQGGSVPLPLPVEAGDWTLAVQALPGTDPGPDLVVAGPPGSTIAVQVASIQTPGQYARSSFAAGLPGAACGTRLIHAFPTLTATALAVAMAQGGYAADATGSGLHAAFPTIAPAAMAAALAVAYPAPPRTPVELAKACFAGAVEGAACGTQLIDAFPALDATALATAMAGGGYAADDTGSGLHAAFPAITPAGMAQALAAAYPPPATTAEALARNCRAAGISGADCGTRLIAAFPTLDATALAIAMAGGGYAAAATASGLHAAFPSITAAQMAMALAAAFP